MKGSFVRLTRCRLLGCALLFAVAAYAQDPLSEEVPYVRTPQAVVDKMLDLAGVGPDDFLIDLGSGDGRIVISAALERGARGFGVDLDPHLVEISNEAARKAGVAGRAQFFARDLFDTDIREASVLTVYLLPAVNLQLRPRLLAQLQPGTAAWQELDVAVMRVRRLSVAASEKTGGHGAGSMPADRNRP